MKFFIASPWRNKETVKNLAAELIKRGYEVYSFLESGANLATGLSITEELETFHEALENWQNDPNIKHIFSSELENLKGSDAVILIQPAGHSSLIETGIGYGMGKKVIIIGPIEKPEPFYLICDKLYENSEAFLASLTSA